MENSVSTVFFSVRGGQKIASRLLRLPSLRTEKVKIYTSSATPDCFRSDWNR